MHALMTQGRLFVRELAQFSNNVAGIITRRKFCLSIILGMAAKLSVMISFLVIVKLISLYVLSDDEFLSSNFMGVFLMFFIPLLLSVSASTLYFDMRLKIHCENHFIQVVRQLNISRFIEEHELVNSKLLTEFVNLDDGRLNAGLIRTFSALFEFIQSVLISIIVMALLFYADWVIALLLFLGLAVITPFFVYWGKKKEDDVLNNVESVQRELNLIKNKLYEKAEQSIKTDRVAEDIQLIVFGHEASLIKKDRDQKRIGSRKAFPFIYGFIGLMFAVLVYTSFSASGDGISTEQFSLWVVVFFALRFMAGAVQSMRNGLFALFSNYKYLTKINSLLA